MKQLGIFRLSNLFVLLFVLFLTGCAQKSILNLPQQSVDNFTKDIEPILDQNRFANEYIKNYHAPKDGFSYDQNSTKWAYNIYSKSSSIYLSNKRLATKSFWESIKSNLNYKEFKKIDKVGIVIKPTYIKNLPTDEPLFRSFDKAGEGYPFDYNQNSYTRLNEILAISHLSLDKKWALVQNHFTVGWIRSDSFKYIDKNEINYQKFIVSTKDNLAIYDKDKNFIAYTKLGTLFPLIKEKDAYYKVQAGDKVSYISKDMSSYFPLHFDKSSALKISNELLGEDYGWGGLLFKRDCSLMTKDFFAPFGIWLARNSKAQSRQYSYIDISNLDEKEKKKQIVQNAKPYRSLIYFPGHIMLYIGSILNEPYIMHNTWGIKTKSGSKKGRYIISKSIISTLDLGKNLQNVDKKNMLIKKAKGIVTIK